MGFERHPLKRLIAALVSKYEYNVMGWNWLLEQIKGAQFVVRCSWLFGNNWCFLVFTILVLHYLVFGNVIDNLGVSICKFSGCSF